MNLCRDLLRVQQILTRRKIASLRRKCAILQLKLARLTKRINYVDSVQGGKLNEQD